MLRNVEAKASEIHEEIHGSNVSIMSSSNLPLTQQLSQAAAEQLSTHIKLVSYSYDYVPKKKQHTFNRINNDYHDLFINNRNDFPKGKIFWKFCLGDNDYKSGSLKGLEKARRAYLDDSREAVEFLELNRNGNFSLFIKETSDHHLGDGPDGGFSDGF